jgi:hypothetical protein
MTARDFPIQIQQADGGFIIRHHLLNGKPAPKMPAVVVPNISALLAWLQEFYGVRSA